MAVVLIGAGIYIRTTVRYLLVIYFGLFFLVLATGLLTTFPAYRG